MDHELEILRGAIRDEKLTIFVGAGISKSSGLPDWESLMNMIRDELETDEKDYLKLAQFYYNHLKDNKSDEKYYRKLSEFIPKDKKPSVIHELIFKLKPKNIITTNWDNLLEISAKNQILIYETISKDEDLIKSDLHNYIIKMHGDIDNKNIVFKEEDYIDYSKKFPIIENYVKSILSTNVTLFMGYSYSDINLKYIIKWLQHHSSHKPKILFLDVSGKTQDHQINYLEDYGITTILAKDTKDNYSKLDKNSTGDYSNRTATFLSRLLNINEINIKNINSFSDKEILEYFYNKLKPLDKLNGILPEQVQSSLTNCTFRYDFKDNKSIVILILHVNIKTYSSNEINRKLNNRFNSILSEKNYKNEGYKNILEKILAILCKSGINGIMKNESIDEYIIFDGYHNDKGNSLIENIISYNFNNVPPNEDDINILMKEYFLLYSKKEYYKAYEIIKEKIIPKCLNENDYFRLFLSMFNHNALLVILKRLYIYKDENKTEKISYIEYDLEEYYNNLPKSTQLTIKELKIFFNSNYLYKMAFEISSNLDSKITKEKSDSEGKISITQSNMGKYRAKMKNLLYFSINNFVVLEFSPVYKINKNLIKIRLMNSLNKEENTVTLGKIDLFSCIKYIDNKGLKEIFSRFYKEKSKNKILNLKLSTGVLKWIVFTVLPNIFSLFEEYNHKKMLSNLFYDDFKNTIFILSLVKLNDNQMKSVFGIFSSLISNQVKQGCIYDLINDFTFTQFSLFQGEASTKGLIDIIEAILNKVKNNKMNAYDIQALKHNKIYHLFFVLDEYNVGNKFKNIDLIKTLINSLKKSEIIMQLYTSKSFLLNLYYISNNDIKKIICNYMTSINLLEYEDDICGMILTYKLSLVIGGINEFEDECLIEIDEYFNEINKNNGNYFFLGELTGQLKYLSKELNIENLQERYKKYKVLLDSVNNKLKKIQG